MKKMFFGLIATVMLSVSGFANTKITEKQDLIKIEKSNEIKICYNLGNVTKLTDSELNSLSRAITESVSLPDNVDECTITLTAEVDLVFGSVSVAVSYTASNCETAMTKAGAALTAAVKKVKQLASSM